MYKARGRYWCPEGCWPAQYAKRFRELPWTYKVELTAPPGCFEGWWRSWPGLSLWEEFGRSVPAERPEWHPFAIWSLARNGDGPLHGHMVVGNLPRSDENLLGWDLLYLFNPDAREPVTATVRVYFEDRPPVAFGVDAGGVDWIGSTEEGFRQVCDLRRLLARHQLRRRDGGESLQRVPCAASD